MPDNLRPTESETIDNGVFSLEMTWPPRVEMGNTARFSVIMRHKKDALINPSNLALKFYDKTGADVTAKFTVGTVTKESDGNWRADALSSAYGAGNQLPEEFYTFEWSFTYTPVGEATARPGIGRHYFRLTNTVSDTTFHIVKVGPDR